MSLTKDMITTLRHSWATAEPKAAALLSRFYETLFEIGPTVAAMFSGTNMALQQNKLAGALGLVIREMENPGTLLPSLSALGRRPDGPKASHAPTLKWDHKGGADQLH